MNRSALALVAVLAASCTASDGPSGPTRSFTVDLPPGCTLKDAGPDRECVFTTAAGRLRRIGILQSAGPFDAFDRPEVLRAAMREDPQGFWTGVVMTWQAQHDSSDEPALRGRRTAIRAFPPPPGAEACVWFAYDVTVVESNLAGDAQVIRCALHNPATDVVEEFRLEYLDVRTPGMAPDPGFAADVERVVRTLRFAPPTARRYHPIRS